jgi:hypothetical protein
MKTLSLLERNSLVARAMDDEERRCISGHVGNRAGSPQLLEVRTDVPADQLCDRGWSIDPQGTARSNEVGRPTDGHNRLYVVCPTAVTGARATGAQPGHSRQVSAGGLTPDTDAVRVDGKAGGVQAQPSQSGLNVVQLSWEDRLPAVPDGDRDS